VLVWDSVVWLSREQDDVSSFGKRRTSPLLTRLQPCVLFSEWEAQNWQALGAIKSGVNCLKEIRARFSSPTVVSTKLATLCE
jgi:hypothetical protein